MTRTWDTEIIAVGTELLLGQIANTNAKWISEQLAIRGINTYYHTVVGDNLERLYETFKLAGERSDIVIITGGLGPTEDDLSREAFQKLSHIPLVTDKDAMDKIIEHYHKQQRTMTPNNKRQARVFENSTVLKNTKGMAPGNVVEYNGTKWIFLPGVPREMKQIFTDAVMPMLVDLNGKIIIKSMVLNFIGIGESALEDRLYDLIAKQDNPTIAPLAKKDGVTIRLTAKSATEDDAQTLIDNMKKAILQRVGKYYYGQDEDTIEKKTVELLLGHKLTIASAESLTGGLFADKLVSATGVSAVFKGAVVCYSSAIKQKLLNVPEAVINQEGTVSHRCAELLAENTRELLEADIGISFTGVAGPDEIEGKEAGTVYIGLSAGAGQTYVEKCFFPGDRQAVRYRSVIKGYAMLIDYLKDKIN